MKKYVLSIILTLLFSSFNLLFSQSGHDLVISDQSLGLTECEGKPVTLFVDAFAYSHKNVTFQWYYNGKLINGEIQPVLNLGSMSSSISGVYKCFVSLADNSESLWAKPITVYSVKPTAITDEPTDVILSSFPENGSVALTFRAHVNGIPIENAKEQDEYFSIQWYKVSDTGDIKLTDNDIYSGSVTNRLTVKLTDLVDTSYYYATIQGRCGEATTRKVSIITNIVDLYWILLPIDYEICENQEGLLRCEGGTKSGKYIDYQWYHEDGTPVVDNSDITGGMATHLIFNTTHFSDDGKYYCVITLHGSTLSLKSNVVWYHVKPLPTITLQPKDGAYDDGTKNVMFQMLVQASDDPTFITFYHRASSNFNWYVLEKEFQGSGLEYDAFANDTSSGFYYCKVRNSCGSVYSDTIAVTVNPKHALSVENLQFNGGSAELYPNPAVESTTLKINLNYPEQVNVSLFNSLSRTEIPVFNGEGITGENYINLDLAKYELASGMYIVKINAGGEVITGKLMIVR